MLLCYLACGELATDDVIKRKETSLFHQGDCFGETNTRGRYTMQVVILLTTITNFISFVILI